MNLKNSINLKANQNILFNLIFCFGLFQNFDIPLTGFIVLIFSTIIFYNYRNIRLNNKLYCRCFFDNLFNFHIFI